MAAIIELKGRSFWYDECGNGEPLVALHPGLVDSRAFGPNIEAWSEQFHVYTPERRGHGHTPDVEGPLKFDDMADDTVDFIESVIGGPVRLLGCSDGAVVALLTAARRPDLVSRLVVISGPAHHDGWYPGVIDGSTDAPEFMHTMYGEVSPDGSDHFSAVLAKMAAEHLAAPEMSAQDLGRITCRTLVMVADDDEVKLEHAIEVFRALPSGELTVVPGTSHGLLVEKPELCDRIIIEFLAEEPIETLAPLRRRPT